MYVVKQLLRNIQQNKLDLEVIIQNVSFTALLDSGADVNCISEKDLFSLPYQQKIKDLYCGKIGIITADDKKVRVKRKVGLTVNIGKKNIYLEFLVLPGSGGLILGIPALQKLKTTMKFREGGITVRINKAKLSLNSRNKVMNILLSNKEKLVLYKNQAKKISFLVESEQPIESLNNQHILVQSHSGASSIIIPCICTIEGGECKILVKNTSNKKVVFNKLEGLGVGRLFNEKLYDVVKVNETNFENWLFSEGCSEKIHNKLSDHNTAFYKNIQSVKKVQTDSTLWLDQDPLTQLQELPLQIPDCRPLPSVEDIIDKELDKTLDEPHKEKIRKILIKNGNAIAKFFYDAGQLKDYKGEIIKVDIPLRKPVPKNVKTYRLGEKQQKTIEEIFDHLIFNGYAKECDHENAYGSPVFIVERESAGQSRPARLICDLRAANESCMALSTPGESVSDCVAHIAQKASFLTQLDLSNAYFSISLSEKAMNTGFSNLLSPKRAIKLTRAPTGSSWIPATFRSLIVDQLNTNNEGQYDPPQNNFSTFYRTWYDDIIIYSTNLSDHYDILEEIMNRLSRMDVRIRLKKCTFVKNLEHNTVKILGYLVGNQKLYPDPAKVKAILNMESPKNFKQTQVLTGHLNWIRNLLPLQASHLMARFSHLTSSKVDFVWDNECEEAFKGIKNILTSDKVFLYACKPNNIKILYCDASSRIYAGNLYELDLYRNKTDKIGTKDLPADFELLNEGADQHNNKAIQLIYKHFLTFELEKSIAVHVPPEKQGLKESFFNGCTILYNFMNRGREVATSKFLEDYILLNMDMKISNILPLFEMDKNKYLQFLSHINLEGWTDEIFLAHFEIMLHIVACVLEINIGLVFVYENRKMSRPFVFMNSHMSTVPYLFAIGAETFYPLINVKEINTSGHNFPSALDIYLTEHSEPDLIFSYFQRVLKEKKLAPRARICGYFSQVIERNCTSKAIFELEARAIFLSLQHFQLEIQDAPLCLVLTDSRICWYLFSRSVQQINAKSSRISLKLQISYPKIRLITINSKANLADMLTRLGLPREEIVHKGLFVIGFQQHIMKTIGNRYLSWTEVQDLCDKYPEAIIFSEKRMDSKLIDEAYLEQVQDSPIAAPEVYDIKRVSLGTHQDFFAKHLNRGVIIHHQRIEYKNLISNLEKETGDPRLPFNITEGILQFQGKIVLPTKLYIIAAFREHSITIHGNPKIILDTLSNLYHLVKRASLGHILTLISKGCLSCLTVNSNHTRLPLQGYFPINLSAPGRTLMCDLIEGTGTDLSESILVCVDVYSRYTSTYILVKKNTSELILCLSNYFGIFGPPLYFVADNAPLFQSLQLKQFLEKFNVKRVESAPYKPEARSLVEGINKILQISILKLNVTRAKREWKVLLSMATFLLNRKLQHHERVSPHMLCWKTLDDGLSEYRKDIKIFKERNADKDREKELQQQAESFEKFRKNIEKAITNRRLRNRDAANEKRKEHNFEVGDYVFTTYRSVFLGQRRKFNQKFYGVPYKVTFSTPGQIYLQNVITKEEIRRKPNDLKKIPIIDPSVWGGVPQEILSKLKIVQPQDLATGVLGEIFADGDFVITREKEKQLREQASLPPTSFALNEAVDQLFLNAGEIEDEFVGEIEEEDDSDLLKKRVTFGP